ncbi:hypothetical protein GCM10020367_63830 [Streptomyces sannanensis]|uniref:Uncharacterized protein n=1 Tax=Streptomyces sannanensis TaxID=285536 RepID=A0ABP6SLR8_9ACTN
MIFYHLGELTLRIGTVTDPPTVQVTRGIQLHLLDLLDTDIGQPAGHRPETVTCEVRR